MRSKVTPNKSTRFLLASNVILKPFHFNALLTSGFFHFLSLGVALHTTRPSSRWSPTRSLSLESIRYAPTSSQVPAPS